MVGTILSVLSTLAFAVAIYFAYKLAKETRRERYWVFFLISALAMGLYHFAIEVPWKFGYVSNDAYFLLKELSEIVWAFALAYACYGIYKSMRTIRKKAQQKVNSK